MPPDRATQRRPHSLVYEARAQVGGNARTHEWDVHGKKVATDTTVSAAARKYSRQHASRRGQGMVQVLYWVPEYYKNYTALLKAIGVTPAEQYLPFMVHSDLSGTHTPQPRPAHPRPAHPCPPPPRPPLPRPAPPRPASPPPACTHI